MKYGWTLDRSKWDLLPDEFVVGGSWNSVQFTLADKDSIPESSGIYLVCTPPCGRRRGDSTSPNDLFGILYSALYVGKSSNLRTRFIQHCRKPDRPIQAAFTCYSEALEFWYHRTDVGSLRTAENSLFDCLGPPANRIRPLAAAVARRIPASSGLG